MASPTSPQQQSVPFRSMSGSDGDAPVQGDDPSEATRLLEERLQAYKHACGYLEEYISATEKMHTSQSKEFEKVLKTVNSPLRENHQFDGKNGGIAEMFDSIRTNTQALSNSHSDTAKNLKSTVLPIFERLHAEIKNKSKELAKGVGAASKSVDKARDATQKHIALLGAHATSSKVEAPNDPYVLQKGIRYRLNKQLQEESNTRQDMLGVQNNFSSFETHVVQTFQEGMTSFQQAVGHDSDQTKNLYGNMMNVVQQIQPTTEWDAFVQRNNTILIDPAVPTRSVENTPFANQNHATTQPLIEGSLERKSGVMRSWSPFFYAVTSAKYLHEFKTDDDIGKDPTPEMSLYLPDTLVGGCNGNEFSIKGKDAGKAKIASKVSSQREFSFRAHTKQEAEMWWGIIRSVAGGDADSSVSSPTTPAPSRDVSSSYMPPPSQQQAPVSPAPQQSGVEPVAAAAPAPAAAAAPAAEPTALDVHPAPVAAAPASSPTVPHGVGPASYKSGPGGTTNSPISSPTAPTAP